jgi:hypothetical protein
MARIQQHVDNSERYVLGDQAGCNEHCLPPQTHTHVVELANYQAVAVHIPLGKIIGDSIPLGVGDSQKYLELPPETWAKLQTNYNHLSKKTEYTIIDSGILEE